MKNATTLALSLAFIGTLLTFPSAIADTQEANKTNESTKTEVKEDPAPQTPLSETQPTKSDGDQSQKPDAKQSTRPRIGLALGGGGSRGAAHVGVLKVLLEEKVPIDIIAGTSIGSVVGSLYAIGTPIDEIDDFFEKDIFIKEFMPTSLYVRLAVEPIAIMPRAFGVHPYDGLYPGYKFRKYMEKVTNFKKIEELPIPFAAVVTDVVTGKSCRLTEGPIATALQASTAVPGLKKPVEIGGRLFCDGGLINNLPVDHVRAMGADFVIAVNIDEKLEEVPIHTFRAAGSMSKQALRIQLAHGDTPSCEKADFAIHPNTTGITLISRKKRDARHGVECGIKAARAVMPELKKKLAAIGIVLPEQSAETSAEKREKKGAETP